MEKLQIVNVVCLLLAFVLSFGNRAWAQTASTVRGRVTEESGETLPGVSVSVKGTNAGMTTDNTRNYQLQYIEPNPVLVFSYVGYKRQEIHHAALRTSPLPSAPGFGLVR